MTRVVLVYDGACGGCSAVAARASAVLVPPVTARSCRDPHLAAEFPILAAHLGDRPCRRPLLVVSYPDGRDRVAKGLAMMWRGALLVAPRRRLAAIGLAVDVLRAGRRRRARRTTAL